MKLLFRSVRATKNPPKQGLEVGASKEGIHFTIICYSKIAEQMPSK
jgi:hypothetical protein